MAVRHHRRCMRASQLYLAWTRAAVASPTPPTRPQAPLSKLWHGRDRLAGGCAAGDALAVAVARGRLLAERDRRQGSALVTGRRADRRIGSGEVKM